MCRGKIVSLYWWRISSKTSYLKTTAFDEVLQKIVKAWKPIWKESKKL